MGWLYLLVDLYLSALLVCVMEGNVTDDARREHGRIIVIDDATNEDERLANLGEEHPPQPIRLAEEEQDQVGHTPRW